jgi:hypothetical protein
VKAVIPRHLRLVCIRPLPRHLPLRPHLHSRSLRRRRRLREGGSDKDEEGEETGAHEVEKVDWLMNYRLCKKLCSAFSNTKGTSRRHARKNALPPSKTSFFHFFSFEQLTAFSTTARDQHSINRSSSRSGANRPVGRLDFRFLTIDLIDLVVFAVLAHVFEKNAKPTPENLRLKSEKPLPLQPSAKADRKRKNKAKRW